MGPNLRRQIMEVDNSYQEFLGETDKDIKLFKQHQHVFVHSYQVSAKEVKDHFCLGVIPQVIDEKNLTK